MKQTGRSSSSAGERLEQAGRSWPARLVISRPSSSSERALDQPRVGAAVADVVEQPLAPRRAALEHQRRIELVRAAVDPVAQRLAARLGESRFLQRAVFEDHDIPAEGAEQRLEALPQAFAHDGVEALAVIVDDPPAIAQALLPAFEHRLEHVAFVELGVADQRHHAALGPRQAPAVGAHIVLHQRGEQASAPRRGRPSRWRNRRRRRPWCARDSSARRCSRGNSRAARGVWRPSRYWIAWKIGLACGFTATRSSGRSACEIERRHDGGERGGRCLMPAHLEPVGVSRRWFAWWIIQLASHSTLRSSSPRMRSSSREMSVCSLMAASTLPGRLCTM